jgi:hypothetical protein
MTDKTDTKRARWRRMLATTRARVEIVALSLTLILFGAVAFTVVPAVANDEKLVGEPVPEDLVPAIVAASLSCPTLNPSRLAAQIMAASGFSEGRAHGNIAAMAPSLWAKWRPTSSARATDRAAAVTAVAHHTCQLVGQVRAGGLDGDLWPGAVAAQEAGVDAVVKAKGVPQAQKKRVERVTRYASWYADREELSAGPRAGVGAAGGSNTVPVPDDLVPAIRSAGAICPGITPVRVAAQLRALSGFNVNLRSDNGAEGVAQFTPDQWQTYRAGGDSSVWNPDDAVMSMGRAMCELSQELKTLDTGDPYVLALGAYQWGAKTIRQAGGLPRTAVPHLADRVMANMAEYEKDTRLTVPPKAKKAEQGKPKLAPSAPASKAADDKAGKAAKKAPKRSQPPVKAPDAGAAAGGYGPYFLFNHRTKFCVDELGTGAGQRDGPLNQDVCIKQDNQEWRFMPRAVDSEGYQLYWIRNADDGWCIDPPGAGAVPNDTPLSVTGCSDEDNQHFRLERKFTADGWQYYWLRNVASDMCLEVPGAGTGGAAARLQMVPCLAKDDHEWALAGKAEW